MSGLRAWGWQCFGCAACAGLAPLLLSVPCGAQKVGAATWEAAVEARQQFEAEPAGTHTKAEYARVMDGFRAIYHEHPTDLHAPRAVEQVAELLAEQGHEFSDARSLQNAAGQFDFLLKNYPQSGAAREAQGKSESLRAELTEAPPQTAASKSEAGKAAKAGKAQAPVDPEIEAVAQADHYHPPKHTHAPPPQQQAAAVDADAPPVDVAVSKENAGRKLAIVSGVRYWSTPSYTRVAIDLGDEVTYQAARVEHPDRIYFDLHHTRLAHELSGKTFTVTDDGLLSKIRAAQFSDDVTRVVLDVHEVGDYSAFLLPNPYRLIIDIHGKGEAGATDVAGPANATDAKSAKLTPRESRQADAAEVAPKNVPEAALKGPAVTGASSLPPMAVTDGSGTFGLPAKQAGTAAVAAQPRVVIPSRPTLQKPVPNTTVSRSAETTSDVAAVSLQPGRVQATSRPTSAPIAAKRDQRTESKDQRAENRDQTVAGGGGKQAHVKGAPVEVPPPTADGQTSLMRALGLKIGRIVIDAGHGGHDSGTLGAEGIQEKDIALDVALRLGKLLHERLGAEIVYTRADDTFIPLETRTAIANKAQADLFISVHCNSSQDASARGVEVYYLNFTSDADAMRVAARENAVSGQSAHELSDLVKKIALKDKIEESRELASDVDDSLFSGLTKGNAGLKNRGVKKAPFVVLIGANMPSILAEISFVTNPQDAGQLVTPEYRERVAESLFKGVQRYAQGINGTHLAKPGTTQRAAVQ